MSDKKRMGDLVRQDVYTPPWWRDRNAPMPLAIDAGIRDIRSNYGPTEVLTQGPSQKQYPGRTAYDSDIRAMQGINAMVANPERFTDAQMQWPESPRAVWMFDDRFRGM